MGNIIPAGGLGASKLPTDHRLDALRIVVGGTVDQGAHRLGAHRPGGRGFRRIRSEHNLRAREPWANVSTARITGIRWWIGATISLAVVVRIVMVSIASAPPPGADQRSPKAREHEELAVLHADRPGLLRRALAPPFVEPVRRDQAAAGGERGPERGFGARRLRTRVDGLAADAWIVCPFRHAAPGEGLREAAAYGWRRYAGGRAFHARFGLQIKSPPGSPRLRRGRRTAVRICRV